LLLNRKTLSYIALAAALTGCGFSPLYGERTVQKGFMMEEQVTASDQLSKVYIAPITDRIGQLMKNNLLSIMAPRGYSKPTEFRLEVEVAEPTKYELALRKDDTSTRETLTYKATYKMFHDTETVIKGKTETRVSYNILKEPYATDISKQYAEKRAAEILSRDIATRIGAYFYQKP